MDTIAAIATGGNAPTAIGVLRVSGPDCFRVCAKVFRAGRPFEALDTVVMLIGLFLIYDGLSDIWIVSRIYRTAKALKQEAEALDVVAKEIK